MNLKDDDDEIELTELIITSTRKTINVISRRTQDSKETSN
jgi:hypothetical protein